MDVAVRLGDQLLCGYGGEGVRLACGRLSYRGDRVVAQLVTGEGGSGVVAGDSGEQECGEAVADDNMFHELTDGDFRGSRCLPGVRRQRSYGALELR